MHKGRNFIYILMSVIISLMLHLALILLTLKIHINPGYFMEPPKTPSRFIKLGGVDVALSVPEQKKDKRPELVPFHADNKLEKNLSSKPMPVNPPKDMAGDSSNIKAPNIKTPDLSSFGEGLTAPQIISVDGDSLPESRVNFNRLLIPKIKRELGGLGAGGGMPGDKIGDGLGPTSIPLKMRMALPGNGQNILVPGTRLLKPENTSAIDSLMDIKIYKYRLQDGGGFFRVDIIPKPDAALAPFKKDIVFCMDVSGSISGQKLAEFKDGVNQALKKLKPDDRFEIVAFRHKEIQLFGSFQYPSPENLRIADEFIYKLVRTGSTNIFSAIKPFAGANNKYKSTGRPLLIFLASDGMVNSGELVDSRDLINAFSNNNQDSASMFTFCTGKKSNSFLLDLLSYRNRGESLKSEKIEDSGRLLADFVDNASDICVTDLDYQISGQLTDLTFPKKLPHLYRGHKLSIYGYYAPDVKQIGIRITGLDSQNRKQELIYKGNIDDAADADANLAKNWAMQYIYNMYSRLSVDYSEELRMQIKKIASQYGVEAPYYDQYLLKKKNYVGK